MDQRHLEALLEGIAPVVREAIAQATAPLLARIAQLEAMPREAGPPGRDGRDGQPGVPGAAGLDGKDGLDGLGFDDLSVEHDGERLLTLSFTRGEQVKQFPVVFPIPLYRGVWKEGAFAKGDGVTLGGHVWIARCDTSAKPGDSEDWKLAVKRGRDGRDRPEGEKKAPETVRFK